MVKRLNKDVTAVRRESSQATLVSLHNKLFEGEAWMIEHKHESKHA